MAHEVFISYSSKDKSIANAVCAILESRAIKCWIAPRDVLPGDNYGKAIIKAINECRILILILTSASNNSPQVQRELERAASKGLIIITFRVENVRPSEDIEYFISSPHWLDATAPPLEAHLNQLVETVSTKLKSSAQQTNIPNDLLRLTVHRAYFNDPDTSDPRALYCFINATNLADTDAVITHVWIESEPRVFAINRSRSLPKRLRTRETWETWIPLGNIPEDCIGEKLFQLARARTSTGEIIHSVKNESVPDVGFVPGGTAEKKGTVFTTLTASQLALETKESVARIEMSGARRVIGTGFPVDGSYLHYKLHNELLLLTTTSLLMDEATCDGLSGARISLDGMAAHFTVADYRVRLKDVLWSSPADQLNTTVIRLNSHAAVKIRPLLIRPWQRSYSNRINLIGHVGGGELSMLDGFLLGYDETKLRYTYIPELCMEGCPIFDEEWGLIGIHHKNSVGIPRLSNTLGAYVESEGIPIRAIKDAIRSLNF